MMTDPIADMLTRIRNANANSSPTVDIPYSKVKEAIAKVLVEEGYLVQHQVVDNTPQAILRVQIKYGPDGERVIQRIQRISKPGCRVYRGYGDLKRVLDGMGISILSTSRGVVSDRQARVRKLGGEVLCEVY